MQMKKRLDIGTKPVVARMETALLKPILKSLTALVVRPHICHGYHGLYLWRKICHVEKFQISTLKMRLGLTRLNLRLGLKCA